MSVSITQRYSQMHRAMLGVAAAEGLTITDVRLLLAIADRQEAGSDTLAVDLCCEPAMVRRSGIKLRKRGLVLAGGRDGGTVRPGVRTVFALSPDGVPIVTRVLKELLPTEAIR